MPTDQPQREAILTCLDTTMLVEASAGAGKTRSMVDRMIALLRQGKCRIETLAAITFTRKAAAELRARFHLALERAAQEAASPAKERLVDAMSHAERVFIGTIHSFCGRLLRERPVEANVEPSFQELDQDVDARLRGDAWSQYVADLIATGDPLLAELAELGLEVGQLQGAFDSYATYPDVQEWPSEQVEPPDLRPACDELRRYLAHMESLIPTLPEDPGRDTLMPKYRRLARMVHQADLDRAAEVMEILEEFGSAKVVQKQWPGKRAQALAEKERWDRFREDTARPLVDLWHRVRYPLVLGVLKGAAEVYDRLCRDAGGMNYEDLLLQAAALLRQKPQIRQYFRRRFTHLLVDEFQDTDPVQAEVMLLLTADDPAETNWRRCKPVPGALFVVGDPKQSIYRFRRADIVTYNEVKRIIQRSGEVVVLSANFRSLGPVIDWVNGTFDQVFPAGADAYSPARSPMEAVHRSNSGCLPAAVEILNIPADCKTNDEAVQYESDLIAREIQSALAGSEDGWTARPGDFLIISTRKGNLSIYARKLTELGIPCEVTGGAVLNEVDELRLLCVCLEALTQPDSALALVAALRSPLFGLGDEALYAFKRVGGRFSFHTPVPDDLAAEVAGPLQYTFDRLRQYDLWLKRLPAVAAIERIAADLGLPAQAAVGAGGSVRAGSIGRAIELIRAAQATLYSIAEIVAYLRQLVDGQQTHDGLPAAMPDQQPVRIMNLHQAKGLEAPIVFLADPTGASSHEPTLHVDRGGQRVRGYLLIRNQRSRWSRTVLACPSGWEDRAARERLFQEAEKNRLMYVAATRAGSRLVVSQRAKDNRFNPWKLLAEYLADCPDMALPQTVKTAAASQTRIDAHEPALVAGRIAARWASVQKASYAEAAAKAISVSQGGRAAGQLVLPHHCTNPLPLVAGVPAERETSDGLVIQTSGSPSSEDELQRPAGVASCDTAAAPTGRQPGRLASPSPPAPIAGAHGTEWGTVIHLLLEAAAGAAETDLLALARAGLQEQELDPALADEALRSVRSVMGSDIWRRAQASPCRLVEVPFQKLLSTGTEDGDALPTIIRGVIDLVFREQHGWVVVDYKTDARSQKEIPRLVEHYRGQVQTYADVWQQTVGEAVVEKGLYFTHPGLYVEL